MSSVVERGRIGSILPEFGECWHLTFGNRLMEVSRLKSKGWIYQTDLPVHDVEILLNGYTEELLSDTLKILAMHPSIHTFWSIQYIIWI